MLPLANCFYMRKSLMGLCNMTHTHDTCMYFVSLAKAMRDFLIDKGNLQL